ncbi:PREDICTED: short-chain dehydrogenase/reductase family 42E member 1-like [Tarenaya hassleriana]|uniref:short-chain dehydrogenase/reductase family 42E member 1-like n=1 Tax=Tarenaya hassleriana TaxID=28532 RepID=UPI00053C123E|nr:PREDICTED: short-chain dehydrogenase/reductase family 42E member 1-like [Tarenaya hassleriana]
MHLSENEGIEGNVFVVTGGLGFVGAALCLELIRRGARHVRSFDLRISSPWSRELIDNGVRCIRGDVTKKEDVDKALKGADCVLHLASFGMSGKEMLQFGRTDEVNINGTCNVLEACFKHEVRRLVYVSTYNVVFGGKEIKNGNEALPYFPMDDHVDAYGRSKSIAEQLVLKSNGRPFKNGGKSLYTCAIRPAAIYGPGEERHLPRIISLAKLGLLLFKTGDSSVKTDWIYIDNLVLAIILASMGLLDNIPGKEGDPVAAGQPYFVSDGSPVNSFEFLRPLLRSLDYDLPKFLVSVPFALFLGKAFQTFYTILYPWLSKKWLPQPLVLPAEVYKVSVTHYFSYLKAKEELGYIPMVSPREGMAATISYWQERKRKSLDGPTIYTWFSVVAGMLALFAAAWLPDIGPVPFLRAVHLFFFRTMLMVRIVCVVSVALHTAEGIYAWRLAKRVDPNNAAGWFWQTFALGIFSMRFLLKRARG